MRSSSLWILACLSLAPLAPAHADATFTFLPTADGNTHLAGTHLVQGAFSDYWNFSLASERIGDFAVGNLRIDLTPTINQFNVSSLSVSLWSGAVIAGIPQPGAQPLSTPVPAVLQASMPAGSYFLYVNGVGDGGQTGQGIYGLSYDLMMPLPEPGSLGLFLGGMGVLAAFARRKGRPA